MKNSCVLALFAALVCVESRLIDLSHKHGPDGIMSFQMPHYNWTELFKGDFQPGMYVKVGAYSTGEHGGTHMDVPAHFSPNGMSVDQIPLEMTIADGVMIDCAYEASRNRSYLMPTQKILDWESVNGRIPDNSAVIVNFGWSQYYNSFEKFMGTKNDNIYEFNFPTLSKEAGDFLYEQRNIKIIGTDTASPDGFDASGLPIHMKYLPNNRLILEELKDTGLLPPKGFRLHASPVKFVGATGAQVRAFAIVSDTRDLECCMNGAVTTVSAFALVLLSSAFVFLG
ncbi:kynurenine formamidase [Biomphalaria pfeifferi]|uniref:Kynurenine formamidase n=1 Tax=Biomphalaria pfeifferi TaxID=112525 RepID=A0AAD8AXV8_BIOPF|nr:kynurenine formamidase [Biomphalaria pfeifferi]